MEYVGGADSLCCFNCHVVKMIYAFAGIDAHMEGRIHVLNIEHHFVVVSGDEKFMFLDFGSEGVNFHGTDRKFYAHQAVPGNFAVLHIHLPYIDAGFVEYYFKVVAETVDAGFVCFEFTGNGDERSAVVVKGTAGGNPGSREAGFGREQGDIVKSLSKVGIFAVFDAGITLNECGSFGKTVRVRVSQAIHGPFVPGKMVVHL